VSEHTTFEQVTDSGGQIEHAIDGHDVSAAVKNVFGGDDYYDPNHHLVMRTEKNVFGDKDYQDGNGKLIAQGMPNHEGGHDLYSGTEHHYLGHSRETPTGHELQDANARTVSADFSTGNGFHTVMHHADPLLHAGEYEIPDLDLM
jgi:hypothetical protein